jgi:hypothetical protein
MRMTATRLGSKSTVRAAIRSDLDTTMETIKNALRSSSLVSLKMQQMVFRNLQQSKMEFAQKCQMECITSLRLNQNMYQLDNYRDIQLDIQPDTTPDTTPDTHTHTQQEHTLQEVRMQTRTQLTTLSMLYIRWNTRQFQQR